MDSIEPTVLHHPADPGSQQGTGPGGIAPIAYVLIIVPIVIVLAWSTRALLRRRTMTPSDRAFRTICRQMHLKPSQVVEIKRFAQQKAHSEPLAVLLSEVMLSEAIGGSRDLETSSSRQSSTQSE